MKRLEEYIREDHKFLVKSKAKEINYKYFPKDRWELVSIIEEKIKNEGNNCDLNDIDVSKVETMMGLFAAENNVGGSTTRCKFNGDISRWDVRTVKNMYCMFENSDFNGDISQWDVSNVEDMISMFENSRFNGDISKWDVSNCKVMEYMFQNASFNGDISDWDVSNVEDMYCMFNRSDFDRDINDWDVRKVKYMAYAFSKSPLENNPPKWYKG